MGLDYRDVVVYQRSSDRRKVVLTSALYEMEKFLKKRKQKGKIIMKTH